MIFELRLERGGEDRHVFIWETGSLAKVLLQKSMWGAQEVPRDSVSAGEGTGDESEA